MSRADLPATDTQRKLIEVFRLQLNATHVEIDDLARSHGASGMESITRRVAGAIITDLQRLKQDHQRRNQP